MSNTLTNLIPTIYEAIDVVSREQVGFIPAVTRNTSAERAALNQSILVPISQPQAANDNTPAVTAPNTGDQTVGNTSITISKSKHVPVRWNGEEQRGATNAGWYSKLLLEQFVQGFRTLGNLVEADLANAAVANSSRAYGTAGTTPLGVASDLSDIAQTRKILDDNGAPQSDLQFVFNSASVANLRGKQSLLLRLNESGSSALLRRGSITDLPVEGFDLHNSAQLLPFVKGTGAAYVTSGSTAPGVGAIALVTGTGTVLAGDVVTFAADTNNKYVNNVAIAAPGTIGLGAPGALVTIATANAMTIGNSYSPNMAFSKSAMQLVTRRPAMPVDMNGKAMDMADDVIDVTDPVSGITYEIALYRQFLQMVFHIRLAWGTAAVKPNHIATLLG